MINLIRSSSIVKNCAILLRKSLASVDFDLKNKYCDENELKSLWNNMVIPELVAEFLCALFNEKKQIAKKILITWLISTITSM